MKPRRVLYSRFSQNEKKVIECMKSKKFTYVDDIAEETGLSVNEVMVHMETYGMSNKYERR